MMTTFVLVWVLNVVDDTGRNTVHYQYTHQKRESCEKQRVRVVARNPTWISATCEYSQIPVPYYPKGAASK